MKVCTECGWASHFEWAKHGVAMCVSPYIVGTTDPIVGKTVERIECLTARTCPELCGMSGKWFEPMDKRQ